MRYLLDTNVLLRIPHRSDASHEIVRGALRALRNRGHRFVTTRQNVAEFWNVCTRPLAARGGFGLTIEEVDRRLRLERSIPVLADPPSAYDRWKRLVRDERLTCRISHVIPVSKPFRHWTYPSIDRHFVTQHAAT